MLIFNTSGPQYLMPSPSTNWLDNASYFYVDLQFNSFYHTSLHLNLTTIQGVSRAVKVQAITEASWPCLYSLVTELFGQECAMSLWTVPILLMFSNIWFSVVVGKEPYLGSFFKVTAATRTVERIGAFPLLLHHFGCEVASQ